MNNFAFEYPYLLALSLLIICIYKCPLSIKRLFFPHTHLFNNKTSWIDTNKLLYSLVLLLLTLAIASPITYDKKESSHRKGRDLVFALDTSGSMAESGFNIDNPQEKKFNTLKTLLSQFISKRYDDNVGVAIFGTFAYGAIPLTYDMKAVSFLLDFFDVGIAGDNTAIGDGLWSALKILKHAIAKEKVIILITDGFQNSGSISIKQAVQEAKKMGVTIYTIGIGKKSDFDEKLLSLIAKETKGKMFAAKDASVLQDVYKNIDKLQPSKIRSQNYLNKKALFFYPLFIAILLLSFLLFKEQKELL